MGILEMALGQLANTPGSSFMLGDPTLGPVMVDAQNQLERQQYGMTAGFNPYGQPNPYAMQQQNPYAMQQNPYAMQQQNPYAQASPYAQYGGAQIPGQRQFTPLWQSNPDLFGPELAGAFQQSYQQQQVNQQMQALQRENEMLKLQLQQMQGLLSNPLALLGAGAAGAASGGNPLALLAQAGIGGLTTFGDANNNPFLAMAQMFSANSSGGTNTKGTTTPPATTGGGDGLPSEVLAMLAQFGGDDVNLGSLLAVVGSGSSSGGSSSGGDINIGALLTAFLNA